MSTDLAIAELNELAFAAFANAASQLSGGDQKPILKCVKGDWYVGQDDEDVPLGTRLAADMMHAEWGWVRWSNGKPVDRRMVTIASGAAMADRDDLGGIDRQLWERDDQGAPRDPWSKSIELPVRELDGERREFVMSGGSMGFQGAFKKLLKEFGEGMRANLGKTPVIELSADKYTHSKYGLTKVPVMLLVEWFSPTAEDAPKKIAKSKF